VANEYTPPSRAGAAGVRWGAVAPALIAVVGDPDGTRRITAIIALLVSIGIGLIMLAVWLFRVTRPDPEVLAPLEVMGERTWRRGDPVWQRRRLDEVRPEGAQPLQPSVAPPELDESFDAGPTASGFDDLHEVPVSIPGDPLLASRSGPSADPTEGIARGQMGNGSGFGPPVVPSARLHQRPRVSLVEASPPPPERPDETEPQRVDPSLRDLPPDDLPPDVIAAAMIEIEAELREGRPGGDPAG
jgi:hypothetical protein